MHVYTHAHMHTHTHTQTHTRTHACTHGRYTQMNILGNSTKKEEKKEKELKTVLSFGKLWSQVGSQGAETF